jgi:DNA-binding NtrC family response regulator
LRERKDDIPILASYFSGRAAVKTKKNLAAISEEAEKMLVAYEWPGNVRELANVIERAVVLGQGPDITIRDLSLSTLGPTEKNGRESLSYRQALEMAKRDVVLGRWRRPRAIAPRRRGFSGCTKPIC